jgi:hypothetical protein
MRRQQGGISFSTNQCICWHFRSKPIRMRNWLLLPTHLNRKYRFLIKLRGGQDFLLDLTWQGKIRNFLKICRWDLRFIAWLPLEALFKTYIFCSNVWFYRKWAFRAAGKLPTITKCEIVSKCADWSRTKFLLVCAGVYYIIMNYILMLGVRNC